MKATLKLTQQLLMIALVFTCATAAFAAKPNVVLVMTDDQGWGQMGYYNHPVLKTPNLDKMAANGLRFDRFYAGGPVCSPTRATVMTGRAHDRTAVVSHGYPLRLQERTVAQAMRDAGYATGHFGKWHLDGFQGPGVPILKDDPRSPGAFGFDEWLSVTNFFDRDPLMSHKGEFVQFQGDSSEIIVDEALKFITRQAKARQPFFAVIWYGSPHSPFQASDEDKAPFTELGGKGSTDHYGELVAMDRSVGALRKGLRDLKVADNTLVWFNSDNGGLPGIEPDTVGGLRGNKGSLFEGGLRVPGVIEWPAGIKKPRVTEFPAGTVDIFPTLVEVCGLAGDSMLDVRDGLSIASLFKKEQGPRTKPLPFRSNNRGAWIDNDWKLLTMKIGKGDYELYNLAKDRNETKDVIAEQPELAAKMIAAFEAWNATVEESVLGKDYPEGRLTVPDPPRKKWDQSEEYKPYMDQLKSKARGAK